MFRGHVGLAGGLDDAIPPDCQRFMAKRMNADVEPVNEGSHAAFIAHPDIAASLILRAIATTRGPI
jgi:pimeloyl-ACP methyl ester carboxylesterase